MREYSEPGNPYVSRHLSHDLTLFLKPGATSLISYTPCYAHPTPSPHLHRFTFTVAPSSPALLSFTITPPNLSFSDVLSPISLRGHLFSNITRYGLENRALARNFLWDSTTLACKCRLPNPIISNSRTVALVILVL